MKAEKGTISIHTENIFPIIKKFLYSDHEIFLRELVSNAVDATQKLKYLSARGEFTGESGDLKISISINPETKTLHITDRGIGMTGEEVKKYINQIAFSGATEFLNKYQEKPESGQLIGNFGLGFYSAFMVASRVEINTRSWQTDATPVRWDCDGSTEFTLEASEKEDRGSEIILHLNADSEEFLQTHRIQAILEKYCRFMPVEIEFDGKIINNTQPLWTRKPTEITNEEYEQFYEELFPFQPKPLFWIHLNVDYPFTLTGILYFPKYRPEIDPGKSRIQLYSRQVFITDAVKEVVPDYLMLLEGVLDSPDIPLNVSRSFLQADQNVKKINTHIAKKVADKLSEIFRENREDFISKWQDIQMFVKFGMLSDEKFLEKAKDFCLLETTDGAFYTLTEYQEKIKEKQTDKNGKVVMLYANNPEGQHTYLQGAIDRGYSVVKMGSVLDAHFTGLLERTMENTSVVSVDSGHLDSLIDKGTEQEAIISETESADLKNAFEEALKASGNFTVETKPMGETEPPLLLIQPEFIRRMRDMAAMGQMSMMGNFPETWTAMLNTSHPVLASIARETDSEKKEEQMAQVMDLALLSAGKLSGERMAAFVKRSLDLMKN